MTSHQNSQVARQFLVPLRLVVLGLLSILFFAFALNAYFGFKNVRESEEARWRSSSGLLIEYLPYLIGSKIGNQGEWSSLSADIDLVIETAGLVGTIEMIRLTESSGERAFVWRPKLGLAVAGATAGEDGASTARADMAREADRSSDGWRVEIWRRHLAGRAYLTSSGGQAVFGVILFLTFVLIAFGVFTKTTVDPLGQLTEACVRRRSGHLEDLNIRSEIEEISVLASAFREMLKVVDSAEAGLSKEVAAKTLDLQEKISELERVNDLMVGRELKMIDLKKQVVALEASAGKRRPAGRDADEGRPAQAAARPAGNQGGPL